MFSCGAPYVVFPRAAALRELRVPVDDSSTRLRDDLLEGRRDDRLNGRRDDRQEGRRDDRLEGVAR